MIEFEKAKIIENKTRGKKGLAIHYLKVVAQVTETAAKALGDDVRNTLYNSKGVIRPSFGQMDLTHAFGEASFHLSVAGVKNAELRLEGILAHRFRVQMRGGGEKKPKTLLCAFEIEYINKTTGSSSIDLWNFVNSFINGVGACRLKYPEQQPMFSEAKEPKQAEIVPGVHKYGVGKYTAEIHVQEVSGGWTSTRKAAAGDKKLPQKPPSAPTASENEALAIAAYDVRQFADKIVAGARGKAKAEAEGLASWASSFVTGPQVTEPPAKSKTVTVAITRHKS